jgi:hypothetical protein
MQGDWNVVALEGDARIAERAAGLVPAEVNTRDSVRFGKFQRFSRPSATPEWCAR